MARGFSQWRVGLVAQDAPEGFADSRLPEIEGLRVVHFGVGSVKFDDSLFQFHGGLEVSLLLFGLGQFLNPVNKRDQVGDVVFDGGFGMDDKAEVVESLSFC